MSSARCGDGRQHRGDRLRPPLAPPPPGPPGGREALTFETARSDHRRGGRRLRCLDWVSWPTAPSPATRKQPRSSISMTVCPLSRTAPAINVASAGAPATVLGASTNTIAVAPVPSADRLARPPRRPARLRRAGYTATDPSTDDRHQPLGDLHHHLASGRSWTPASTATSAGAPDLTGALSGRGDHTDSRRRPPRWMNDEPRLASLPQSSERSAALPQRVDG